MVLVVMVVSVRMNGNNLTKGGIEKQPEKDQPLDDMHTKAVTIRFESFVSKEHPHIQIYVNIFPAICAREKKRHRFSLLLNVPLQNQKRNEWMKTRRKNQTYLHILFGVCARLCVCIWVYDGLSLETRTIYADLNRSNANAETTNQQKKYETGAERSAET